MEGRGIKLLNEEYQAIGEKIRKAREAIGISQEELGKRLGFSGVAISHYEKGRSKIAIDDLRRIAEITGKPMAYFLGEDYEKLSPEVEERIIQQKIAPLLKVKYIPVLGKVAAGNPILAVENIIKYIPVPEVSPIDCDYALIVKGDSMKDAGIEDGDYVLIRQQDYADSIGQIVVCLIDGEQVTLKELWRDEQGQWWLRPRNNEYDPIPVNPDSGARILGVYTGFFRPARDNGRR